MKPVSDSTLHWRNASANCTSANDSSYSSSDNETSGDYSGDSIWPTVSVYVISCCYAVTSVVGVIGNGVILVAFFMERKLLRNNFNLLILNLTLTDLCIALLDLPFQLVANQLGYWPFNAVECALLIFCDWGMTFVSIFTLVAISIDRYWAACWSQNYRIHNTRKRTLICIALIWTLLTLTWTPAYLVDRIRVGSKRQLDCDFSLSDNPEFAFCVIVACYHIPSFIMIACYAKVYQAVRRARQTVTPSIVVTTVNPASEKDTSERVTPDATHQKRLGGITMPSPIASISRVLSAANLSPVSPGRIVNEKVQPLCRREVRVFRSLSYIVAAYLVLWTPCHITVDVLCFDASLVSDDLYSYVSALCYINSALNPFLYAASSDQTRRALRRIFCLRKRRC